MFIIIYLHCVHYHEKRMEESEAAAKNLKLLQREHQESINQKRQIPK